MRTERKKRRDRVCKKGYCTLPSHITLSLTLNPRPFSYQNRSYAQRTSSLTPNSYVLNPLAICFSSSHDRPVTACATMVKVTLLCVFIWDMHKTHTHTQRAPVSTPRKRERHKLRICYVSLWFCSTRAYTLDSLVMSDFLESSSTHAHTSAASILSLFLHSRERIDCPLVKSFSFSVNDPSAGSPTETLLRLLLPLSAPVRTSFRQTQVREAPDASPRFSLVHPIGSSDGRCVQRAGTESQRAQ